jgi:hypothetical protein
MLVFALLIARDYTKSISQKASLKTALFSFIFQVFYKYLILHDIYFNNLYLFFLTYFYKGL